MCGICGKLNFDHQASVSPAVVKAMADAIAHRGPDDDGYYFSGPVGLGFRRLAIIDLSTGHQPISNEDGTAWIVFNGEIYNYQELRDQLRAKGHAFKTQSDTEVIVHLYEEFGETCVEKLRGMFAFAIWDDRQKTLFLARDRVGIKPLYYYLSDKCLIFASEIKAILADPEVQTEVVPEMIDRFLSFYYVPGEQTLFRNVYKLAPGSSMVVRAGAVQTRKYWDLGFSPSAISEQEAEAQLSALLEESLQLHMISDVPVGFLLSGGIDSTAMLGLAVGKTNRALSSYTIGFSGGAVTDERPYARLAAARYRSRHHEMSIGPRDFADFLPQYVWYMEEPVCEPPAVALYYVSRLAKDYVKVLISGEGGDEAFAGYPDYRTIPWIERLKQALKPLNGNLSQGVMALGNLLGSKKLKKHAPLFSSHFEDYYYSRSSNPFTFFNSRRSALYTEDFARHVNRDDSAQILKRLLENSDGRDILSKMLYVDTKTWLPDDLLIKADKMTMANSIELRVPLLDHKVLEFAASLPQHLKVHGFTTKYIAKKTLRGRVPREILHRKKAGFPVPCDAWMRADLKDWISDILLDRQTIERGYFRRDCVEHLLTEHRRSGAYVKEVFSLVVLELWHRVFFGKFDVSSRPTARDFEAVVVPTGLT